MSGVATRERRTIILLLPARQAGCRLSAVGCHVHAHTRTIQHRTIHGPRPTTRSNNTHTPQHTHHNTNNTNNTNTHTPTTNERTWERTWERTKTTGPTYLPICAMLCDAMRCHAMRCDAMRCDAMRCCASIKLLTADVRCSVC